MTEIQLGPLSGKQPPCLAEQLALAMGDKPDALIGNSIITIGFWAINVSCQQQKINHCNAWLSFSRPEYNIWGTYIVTPKMQKQVIKECPHIP